MNKITLHTEGICEATIIPNTFIDLYMPSANGSYVKVYLYLLRSFSSNNLSITISSIADHLENTEKDVIRALNYWEKQKLLILEKNQQKEITSIRIAKLQDQNTRSDHSQILTEDTDSQLDEIAVSIHSEKAPVARQKYSQEKITKLTNNDDIKWTMHIVEIYLDRPLKPMDIQLILYLFEELHFSPELIMYLYEYCVSKNKKNPSYIEAVALTWAKEGIDTEEKAREATVSYNEHFNNVNKAFGLNRAPGQIERQYITKWVEVFSFPDDIIVEACNRTLLRTQKPDFKYADKILETWFKKGVKSKTDIARLDEEFAKGNKSKPKVTNIHKLSSNKFNQFPQRTYTSQDYAELEKKLINKGL
ncbi:MAG: DnaD domain protein [Clostridiales bacterium]|nr:DnaD domain protein [Bacillota bacterium]NLK04478.1 DnaD domain protein [Clostridiales bacterium]